MELRDPTKAEKLQILQVVKTAVPERHRDNHQIREFITSSGGITKGYYLVGNNRWMVDDSAVMPTMQEYYCPTQDEIVLCSGPCPDGTPHTRIENN